MCRIGRVCFDHLQVRRVVFLLLLSGALATLSGCGSQPTASEESVTTPTTARLEVVTRFSGNEENVDEYRFRSVIDYVRDRGSSVEPMTGCRSISIGSITYTEVPRNAALPEGKRWVKSSWDAAGSEAAFEEAQKENEDADGSTLIGIVIPGPPDPPPAEYLDFLRGQTGGLERVGREDVRGVQTTRYRTTRDTKEVMRRHLEDEGWKDANIERYLETMPQAEEQVEIWVDADGLARRVVTSSDVETPGFGRHRSLTTTEYFDFGLETAIEPPPAAEVLESGEWQERQEQQWRELTEEEDVEAAAPLPRAFEPNVSPSCLH